MKHFNILLVFLFGIFSGYSQSNTTAQPNVDAASGTFYGTQFKTDKVQTLADVWEKYSSLGVSDSLNVSFKTKVKEVCKVKGCWMIVELPNQEQAMVRFKDYGFFMPTDIPNKEVILNGVAFVEEMSVADQQHYAEDAGQKKEDVAKITAAKRTYSFVANGVLVPN